MALQLFKIASTTVETPQASIDFTSIPSGYTDLIIKASTRRSTLTTYGTLTTRFNNDTGSNYSYRYLEGDGATVSSASSSATTFNWVGNLTGNSSTTNTFGSLDIYIPNYTSSNQKSFSVDAVGENNATTAYANFVANLWTGTSAITSITILPGSGSILTNSTFTLYGVL